MSSEYLSLEEIQGLPNPTQVSIAWVGEASYAKYWIARRPGFEVWTIWRGKWMRQITKTGDMPWDVQVRRLKNPAPMDPVWIPGDVDYTPAKVPKKKAAPKPPKPKKPPKPRKPKKPKKPKDPRPEKKRKSRPQKVPTPGVLELVEQTDLSEECFATTQSHPFPTTRWHIIFSGHTSHCWKQLAMADAKPVDEMLSTKYICIDCLKKLNRKQREP